MYNYTQNESNIHEEEVYEVVIHEQRCNYWKRVTAETNQDCRYYDKSLVYPKYMGLLYEVKTLSEKGGYYQEMQCYSMKKLVCRDVDKCIFNYPKENSGIGL